jgi:RimJ/RimL family protein N-acetyltransferase
MSSTALPHTNELGQPIGAPLPGWSPPPRPPRQALVGRYCQVVPLDAERHAAELFEANAADADGAMWTYLAVGPYDRLDEYAESVRQRSASADPQFYAIVDGASQRAAGMASYLRIDPPAGSIEVGHLAFAPALQRTRAATEAMYLMARQVFELGYRRYEWKCDALNARSRAAAQRFGFSFEGIFRQATVYKGRNRDTAWFAMIDREWPALQAAYERWLAPENFDAQGRQRQSLSELTGAALRSW